MVKYSVDDLVPFSSGGALSCDNLLESPDAAKTLVMEELLNIKGQLDDLPPNARFMWIDRMLAWSKHVHGDKPEIKVQLNADLNSWDLRHSKLLGLKKREEVLVVGAPTMEGVIDVTSFGSSNSDKHSTE